MTGQASVMLDGKCRRCLQLFEGTAPTCWCAWCHGMWASELTKTRGELGVAMFLAIRNDNDGWEWHFRCPTCGERSCDRASYHSARCENV